jgi:hypothetical protein
MRGLATLALIGTLALTTLAGAAEPPSGIARFREQVLTYNQLGTFQGATEVWRTRVLLLGVPQTVGYGSVACVYVVDALRECSGTYVLPRGLIQVAGRISSRQSFELLIVAGSGVYGHASGTLTGLGAADTRILVLHFS